MTGRKRAVWRRRPCTSFDAPGRAVTVFTNEYRKRVAAVTDFAEEREDRRIVGHKHRSELPVGGGIAETSQNLAASSIARMQQGAASFCFVPQDPQVTIFVHHMSAFVFDIELASPDALLLQLEVVGDKVLEKEFAIFGLLGKSEVAVGNAAKMNRAARVDVDATVNVRKMFQRHDGRGTIDNADVRFRVAVVINPASRAYNASYPSANDHCFLHRIESGEKDGRRTRVHCFLNSVRGISLSGRIRAEVIHICQGFGIVPGNFRWLFHQQSQRTRLRRKRTSDWMRAILGDVRTGTSELVRTRNAESCEGIRSLNITKCPAVASRSDISQKDPSAIEVDDRRHSGCRSSASQLSINQAQRAVALNRGNRIVADETSDADSLTFVRKAELRLTSQCDMLEGLPVYRSGRADTALKANDFTVADQQRAIHVTMTEIESHEPAAVCRNQSAVAHRTGIVGIKLQTDRTRIVFPDIERHVLDLVVKPVGRSESAAPHHTRRLIRIGKRGVLKSDNGLPDILSLNELLAPRIRARRVFL